MPLNPFNPHALPTQALHAQFASRPRLDTVARQLLTDLIKKRYPTLEIDLSRTQLATPAPTPGWTLSPFMPRVLDFLATGTEIDLSDQHSLPCFLTDQPPTRLRPPGNTAPALDMSVIEEVIHTLALTLPTALQNALATYWGETGDGGVTRWRWFSNWLADNLRVTGISQPDLEAPERDMLEQLIQCPDRDERIRRYAADAVYGYCPQATLKTHQQTLNLLSPVLLLAQKNRVLLCQPGGNCERFSSVDACLQAWGQRVAQPYAVEQVTLRRWQPDGNLFDAQAALLLNQQVQDLGAIILPARQTLDSLRALCLAIGEPLPIAPEAPAPQVLANLRRQIPAWLQRAPARDQMRYASYSLALASAKKSSHGKTFLSDIPDIRTFATQALLQQLKRDEITFDKIPPDQSKAAHFHPDDLQLTFSVAVGYPGGAGFVEPVHMSLTDLAINNLLGQPRGQLSVQHRRSLPLPTWLTPDYIKGRNGLIEQVDIGKHYPELLDTQLLGDSDQARQRIVRFAQQTAVQLPLQALELSLKNQNGMTALGARYVTALMGERAEDRVVEGQTIVIRHLSLLRKPQAAPDAVTNMYIIESEGVLTGPHILYRPLYAEALHAFASREDLLQAIATPGELHDSVLTWLSDGARPIYDNGGFMQPHYPRFGMGDEFSVPEVPKPATLATDGSNEELRQCVSNGQLMQFLYGSNARALVNQADRASVSNHESRWGQLLEGAGLLFNTLLLPLARGPLMLTGWLFSLMASASHDIPALNSDDPVTRELALVDLLLNVGMLIHQLPAMKITPTVPLADEVRQHTVRSSMPARVPEQWPQPPEPVMHSGPVLLQTDAQYSQVDFRFSSARQQLTAEQRTRLATFRTHKPDPMPRPEMDGPCKGLYSHLRDWYALVDDHWYSVNVAPDASVVIVDPLNRTRLGPLLKTDGLGNWSLDLSLRLRGGMPNKRIAAKEKHDADRKKQLADEYEQFLKAQQAHQKKADDAEMLMHLAATHPKYSDAAKASTRRAFDSALNSQSATYRKILDSRQERSQLRIPLSVEIQAALLENTVNNARKSVVIADMDRQALHALNRKFIANADERMPVIRADLSGYMQFLKDLSEVNQRQINALELKDQALQELFDLGQAGLERYNRLTQNRPAELGSIAVKYSQLNNLKYLSIKTWGHSSTGELASLLDPLSSQIRTHGELHTLALAPEDRLNVLDSLFQHYGQAVDALQGMAMVHADNLDMAYFARVQRLVEELYRDVVQQLAIEVKPETAPARRPPKRPLQAEGKPQKKVIKTRKHGVLIGDLKPAGTTLPIDVVEVRAEQDDQLLGSYSLRDNQWDEIREVRPAAPALPPGTRALNLVKGDARKSVRELASIITREEGYAQMSRFPIEIQESLHKAADRFTELADELARALQALPEGSRVPADQTLLHDMQAAATTLRTKGRELRIQRTLELPPTDSHLVYLLEQQRVQLARLGSRVPMRGERRDFIQEYAINDTRGFPLWYAHFHYPAANTPKHHFSVAHLKTRAQRTDSYYSLLAKTQSPQSVVDVHRGAISRELAERHFLPLAP